MTKLPDKVKKKLFIAAAILLYGFVFLLRNAMATSGIWIIPFLGTWRVPTLLLIMMTIVMTLAFVWGIGPAIRFYLRTKFPTKRQK